MGIIGGFLKDMASGLGEIGRMERTAREEQANMTDELWRNLNNLIAQAEAGDVGAMVTLAEAYIEGTVLRYDPQEACRWWTAAANAGHRDSMYNLGLLYRGDFSKQFYNDELAAFWLNEASIRGDAEAREVFNQTFKYSHLRQKWVRK